MKATIQPEQAGKRSYIPLCIIALKHLYSMYVRILIQQQKTNIFTIYLQLFASLAIIYFTYICIIVLFFCFCFSGCLITAVSVAVNS